MSSVPSNIILRQALGTVIPGMVGLAGVVIASLVWQYRLRFPFDDAFITFRYAEHVASGNGLVWNIGGPHTEGYTNFLFVLLLAGIRFLTSDLLVACADHWSFSTIVTGIVLYRIGSKARGACGRVACVGILYAYAANMDECA